MIYYLYYILLPNSYFVPILFETNFFCNIILKLYIVFDYAGIALNKRLEKF